MDNKPSPVIAAKTSAAGRIDLPVAEFLAELFKARRGVAFMDANHGDPAMPNFLARNAGALKKAGVARHFDEFPSSNQGMVDAPSLRDLAVQAEALGKQMEKGEKELKQLTEKAPPNGGE
jgi:hypothetical protein